MIRYWPGGATTRAGMMPMLEDAEVIEGITYRFVYIPPCLTPGNPDGKEIVICPSPWSAS